MRGLVTALLFSTAFVSVAACAGSSSDDDTDGAGADITAAQAGCKQPDKSFSGPGKVTATTSGVRCYDDKGAVAGSMGAQATVTVAPGTSAGAAKNPNRLHVTGTNTVDKKQLSCWLPTTYLCTAQSATIAKADGGAEAGPAVVKTGPEAGAPSNAIPSIFCEFPTSNGVRQAFIGDCRTVDGETSICFQPDLISDARWVQFDPSTQKCSSMSTNNDDPTNVCGTSLPGTACSSSAASSFVSQCASAGGATQTSQSGVNGSIGTAHCDCSCAFGP
jgi:hypothetical protein